MKIVLQRCTRASVTVENEIVGEIAHGLVLFVAIERDDNLDKAAQLARKIVALRVFDNEAGKFDRSVRDVSGKILVISNFTLCGATKKGTRPDFGTAAPPEIARELMESFVTLLQEQDVETQVGRFGAQMDVAVENDGPVTMILTA